MEDQGLDNLEITAEVRDTPVPAQKDGVAAYLFGSAFSDCQVYMFIMSQFTCLSCKVAFNNGDIQRQHYKSDWHRYNLKRKVAELPSVTAEDFQRRVLQQQSKLNPGKNKLHCNACRKYFTNEKAFENHLNSKKHKDNAKDFDTVKRVDKPTEAESSNANEDYDLEEVDSDEWDDDIENPIDNNDCLFCSHHSASIIKNVKHMTAAHSFFVPDVEYCVDLRGLLEYLGEKITKGFMCIWCNEKGKSFHSADAARKHMIDKGHCKMIHEGLALAEYVDYYDYSTSYPDAAVEGVDKDEEVDIPELDGNDYQLVLPSGVVVGHRSLMKYYKQNIDPNRQVVVHRNNKKLHKVLAHYKALGWSAAQQEVVARTARDVHYMKRMQAKLRTNLGIKANKLQKHFRPQVNF
ncbi:hypothetical protein FQR65_LT13430 [Abscondita terminalis]|nr:hypothetical protein FQR65_LT13430 [Abscondita terminalis]